MSGNIHHEKPKIPFFSFTINSLTSGVAILLSIASLFYSYWSTKETNEHDAIKTLYGTYFEISKTELQIPQAMHVFVLPGAYQNVARDVREAVKVSTPEEKARYRLSERAMAGYLFSLFEETLYDYRSALAFGDTNRANFEKETLDYFTIRLLRNPRLLYYWDKSGGDLSAEYSSKTIEYYEQHVLNDKVAPLKEKPDDKGPLAE